MTDVETALSEGTDLLEDLLPLLAVPVVVSLLNVSDLRTALEHRGNYIGLTFPLPAPVADLWTFVHTPGGVGGGGATLHVEPGASGAAFPVALVVIVAFVVIESLLTAGYVGSIQQFRRQGRYDFAANARAYWGEYLTLLALLFGAILLLVPVVATAPGLLVLAVPALLAALYLFWGAWFLIPIADLGPTPALRRSYALATTERAYIVWSIAHLALGGVLSLLLTAVVSAAGLLGVLVALCVAVPVGFVLTAASLRIVDDLVGPGGASAHTTVS